MAEAAAANLQLKVFLSHGYRSTAENLYFCSLLAEEAQFQFEVDIGKKATSVTRLELLLRECDGFVGVFAVPDESETAKAPDLVKASGYFRLETDLAVRARKPALLYIDRRYRPLFRVPAGFYVQWFNAQEVRSSKVSPSRAQFQKVCRDFCREVAARKSYELFRKEQVDPDSVAIILAAQDPAFTYSDAMADRVSQTLAAHDIHGPKVVRYPLQKRRFQLSELDDVYWAFVDVGPTLCRTGLVGYLHGRFVPMVRSLHVSQRAEESIADYRSLYVGIENGYDSDLIRWDTEEALIHGLENRLELISGERRLITNAEEAKEYFSEAKEGKQLIFLSYSGKDVSIALQIREALSEHFKVVFDYRQLAAISPGQPWKNEITQKVEEATVGVQLLSNSYFKSGHCQLEARLMNNRAIDGKMAVIPIRISDEPMEGAPAWQLDMEYLRLYEYGSINLALEAVTRAVKGALNKAA